MSEHLDVEGITFDTNFLAAGESYPDLPQSFETIEDILEGFVAVSAPGVSFFRHVVDYNANLVWVRIKNVPEKGDVVISIIVDRWHDNVRVLFEEKSLLNPNKDRADFVNGFVGSYPNYFFILDYQELPDFFDTLNNYDGTEESSKRMETYGINRAQDNFWEVYDWFQMEYDKSAKQNAGLADLNRYFYHAIEQ